MTLRAITVAHLKPVGNVILRRAAEEGLLIFHFFGVLGECVQLGAEVVDGCEAVVFAGVADVSDLVEIAEALHDALTDHAAGHFAIELLM